MEDELEPLRAAQRRGEAAAGKVADLTGANSLERETIANFERLVRHGSKFIDLHVRVDGQEYHFEADWLARLFRRDLGALPSPAETTADHAIAHARAMQEAHRHAQAILGDPMQGVTVQINPHFG